VTYPTGQLASDLYIRAFQFCYWACVGLWFPFLSAYYRTIGLSGTEIGLIGSLTALTGAAGAALWGMLHDQLGKSRWVFSGICWGAILMVLLLIQQHQFPGILLVAGLLGLFVGPSGSQMDSMTLKLLGPRTASYGSYRAWGTTGFVVSSALAGIILQGLDLSTIFILFPAALFLFWLVTTRLPNHTIHHVPPLFDGLRQIGRNRQWLLLMGSVFLLWTGVLSTFGLLGVIMKDMGSGEQEIGMVYTLAAVAEIPLLLGGPYILRRFGATRLILAAMVAYTLRMVIYALAVTPQVVVAISLMQSITYCPFLIGVVALANQLAPDELKSTSQGLLGMVMSLSNVFGGLAGGWLYDHTGQVGLFTGGTITTLLALALLGIGTRAAASAAARASTPA
jgi:PPP family 3-phenylpropionic acid transporter